MVVHLVRDNASARYLLWSIRETIHVLVFVAAFLAFWFVYDRAGFVDAMGYLYDQECFDRYKKDPRTNPYTLRNFMSSDPCVTKHFVYCRPMFPVWGKGECVE